MVEKRSVGCVPCSERWMSAQLESSGECAPGSTPCSSSILSSSYAHPLTSFQLRAVSTFWNISRTARQVSALCRAEPLHSVRTQRGMHSGPPPRAAMCTGTCTATDGRTKQPVCWLGQARASLCSSQTEDAGLLGQRRPGNACLAVVHKPQRQSPGRVFNNNHRYQNNNQVLPRPSRDFMQQQSGVQGARLKQQLTPQQPCVEVHNRWKSEFLPDAVVEVQSTLLEPAASLLLCLQQQSVGSQQAHRVGAGSCWSRQCCLPDMSGGL